MRLRKKTQKGAAALTILVVMCQLALVVGQIAREEFAVPVKVTKVWFAGRWEALPAPGEDQAKDRWVAHCAGFALGFE